LRAEPAPALSRLARVFARLSALGPGAAGGARGRGGDRDRLGGRAALVRAAIPDAAGGGTGAGRDGDARRIRYRSVTLDEYHLFGRFRPAYAYGRATGRRADHVLSPRAQPAAGGSKAWRSSAPTA
jgi:hypothetical protein